MGKIGLLRSDYNFYGGNMKGTFQNNNDVIKVEIFNTILRVGPHSLNFWQQVKNSNIVEYAYNEGAKIKK